MCGGRHKRVKHFTRGGGSGFVDDALSESSFLVRYPTKDQDP